MLRLRQRATPDAPLHPAAPIAKSVVQLPATNVVAAPRLVRFASAAEPGRPKRRLHFLSFVLLVLLPIAGAATYLFGIAANQYVAEFRFTLRTAETSPVVVPRWLAGAATADDRAGLESRLLVEYVRSRAIVDDVSDGLDLRRIYSSPAADWWARLDAPAPIERLVAYWRHQVSAYYDPADQTVAIRVRAFTPRDALRVAQAVVAACQRLVDNLSLQARRDALRQAEANADKAKRRLAAVLAQIGELQTRDGMLDPDRTAASGAALAARVQQELVAANTRLTTLESYMSKDSPAVSVLKARIRSLEKQRRGLADAAAGPNPHGGETLSHALGSFAALQSERKFAEDAYQHALAGLDAARANADRQHVYVASFVPPRLPEEPLYPRRWRALGVVALISLAAWGIGCLTLHSIRDHL